jgi:hypothetical protein
LTGPLAWQQIAEHQKPCWLKYEYNIASSSRCVTVPNRRQNCLFPTTGFVIRIFRLSPGILYSLQQRYFSRQQYTMQLLLFHTHRKCKTTHRAGNSIPLLCVVMQSYMSSVRQGVLTCMLLLQVPAIKTGHTNKPTITSNVKFNDLNIHIYMHYPFKA